MPTTTDAHARPEASTSKPKRTLARLAREWMMSLAFALVILIPIRSSIADWNDVPSGSMRPTILEGERILVNKLAFGLRIPLTHTWVARWGSPKRGDIITFASPKDGERLVKRVIGLAGDRIAMRDNTLWINGVPVARADIGEGQPNVVRNVHLGTRIHDEKLAGRAHAITLTPRIDSQRTFEEITVPAGECFVMGDNRDVSGDSRYFGCVPMERIYGRAGAIAVSLDPQNWYMPRWGRWMMGLK
ncbi:MAG: signal peptidase I [Phycisphaerales bacterium]|nr:signal peptidase I [Phycisphaerales bacterium]